MKFISVGKFRLRYGFSLWLMLLAFICILLALSLSGLLKIIPILLLVLILIFIFTKYRIYNSQPWRKVHYPAMIIYAGILGSVFDSQKERNDLRDKYTHNNCKALLAKILGKDINDQQVCSSLLNLEAAKGEYLSNMLEAYAGDSFTVATLSEMEHFELSKKLLKENIDMGPYLVIAKAIEILYGKEEAGKYAVAILKGDAK